MWWVKENKDHSRGGFQNRDVGKSYFDDDFGPEFGPDYARYSDPPDLAADQQLKDLLTHQLHALQPQLEDQIEINVRNGFVMLKGEVMNSEIRAQVAQLMAQQPKVRDVINLLVISPHQ